MFLGFPGGSADKESTYNAGDLGWEDPLKVGKAIHSSILAWRMPWTVHGVAKSRSRQLKLFEDTFPCKTEMLTDMGSARFSPSVAVILRAKFPFLMPEFISDFLSCKTPESGFK